jgi:predicted SnoaL-like aldol condensation-catalyzing enzyme
MKIRLAVLALLISGSALAADMTPILSNGPGRSDREEYANKALGLLFHRTLFAEGDPQLAADLIMAANFVNHDVDEASGGENFAQFFLNPTKFHNNNPNRYAPHTTTAAQLTRLFSVTDSDITMMAYPGEGSGDPGAQFASNMFETKQGKVTQWWFSGPLQGAMGPPPNAQGGMTAGTSPTSAPNSAGMAAAPVTRDFTKWYPQAGNTIVGMPMVIPNGMATRVERDANKKLVAEFFNEFFNNQNYAAASKYLSADLKSHIKDSPQGSAFVDYAKSNKNKVTAPNTDQVLFLLADGELVDIGWPRVINDDPGAWYGQNLLRVKNGKIVEWWFSGYPNGEPHKANPWNSINSISNTREVAGN